jgi:hypothetical protein
MSAVGNASATYSSYLYGNETLRLLDARCSFSITVLHSCMLLDRTPAGVEGSMVVASGVHLGPSLSYWLTL